MEYRTLNLTLGELRVTDALLTNPEKADLVTARKHSEIRASLQLRRGNKDLAKLNTKGQDLGIFQIVPTPQGPQPILLQWIDMFDPETEILELVRKRIEELVGDDAPEDLVDKHRAYLDMATDLLAARECSLTLDSLRTLNKAIDKKDWNKMMVRDRMTGIAREERTVVPAAQLDIFAELGNKVNAALNNPEPEE